MEISSTAANLFWALVICLKSARVLKTVVYQATKVGLYTSFELTSCSVADFDSTDRFHGIGCLPVAGRFFLQTHVPCPSDASASLSPETHFLAQVVDQHELAGALHMPEGPAIAGFLSLHRRADAMDRPEDAG